jgi:hypothetical protein
MTSLLRKKLLTTRPNFRTGNSGGLRVEGRELNRKRGFGALVALAVLAVAIPARADVTKLQWSKDRAPVKKQAGAKQAGAVTALRFVKPGMASTKHNDAAIKLAAFEENSAPRLVSGRDSDMNTRSVVVSRDNGESNDSADGFRSAQLPSAGNPASKEEDGLRSPFTDNPEEPNKLDTPPMPEPDNNSFQLNQRQNQLNQQQDAAAGTQDGPPGGSDAGQFQPVLPAGPGPDQSPPLPVTNEAAIQAEGEKAKESCDKSLDNLRAYTVDKVNLNIAIVGTEGQDYPFECSVDDGATFNGRCWDQTTYMWKASAMCHKPLYFEDEQLERYGHSFSPCFQPFVSGAHFFTRPFVLPYCMGVEPPNECIYALGHYRPGNCAPYMCNPVPLSLRGALFEAGAVTGAAAILP